MSLIGDRSVSDSDQQAAPSPTRQNRAQAKEENREGFRLCDPGPTRGFSLLKGRFSSPLSLARGKGLNFLLSAENLKLN